MFQRFNFAIQLQISCQKWFVTNLLYAWVDNKISKHLWLKCGHLSRGRVLHAMYNLLHLNEEALSTACLVKFLSWPTPWAALALANAQGQGNLFGIILVGGTENICIQSHCKAKAPSIVKCLGAREKFTLKCLENKNIFEAKTWGCPIGMISTGTERNMTDIPLSFGLPARYQLSICKCPLSRCWLWSWKPRFVLL